MEGAEICECSGERVVGTNGPFGKLIAFGYYDGPTDGVALCKAEIHAYRFSLIGWNEMQDRRLIALRRIKAAAFNEILEIARRVDASPRWPVWVPNWSGNTPSGQEVETRLGTILAEAEHATAIVLSDSFPGQIDEAWPITPEIALRLTGLSSDLNEAWKQLAGQLPDPEGKLFRDAPE